MLKHKEVFYNILLNKIEKLSYSTSYHIQRNSVKSVEYDSFIDSIIKHQDQNYLKKTMKKGLSIMFNPEPVFNEKAIDENEFCRQAIFRMSSSLNINTVMESCMVYIKQYIPMNGIHFCVYEKGLKRFRLIVSVWHSDLPKPKKSMPVHEKFWESIDITIKAGPAVKIYDNNDTYGSLLPYAKDIRNAVWPKQGSFIVMDLEMDNKRLGMLILYSEEDNIYNKEHARLISMLHDQFSILLANVLRYNELITRCSSF